MCDVWDNFTESFGSFHSQAGALGAMGAAGTASPLAFYWRGLQGQLYPELKKIKLFYLST